MLPTSARNSAMDLTSNANISASHAGPRYGQPYTLALSGFAGPPVLSDFIALAVGALDSDHSFTSSVGTCVLGFLLRISEPSAYI